VKFDQTRAYIATIRHDLRVGNHEHARRLLGELVNWPGDPQRATTAQVQEALAGIEAKLQEMDDGVSAHSMLLAKQ
jgi:hypothetical protein